jgi:hypothetical protein
LGWVLVVLDNDIKYNNKKKIFRNNINEQISH